MSTNPLAGSQPVYASNATSASAAPSIPESSDTPATAAEQGLKRKKISGMQIGEVPSSDLYKRRKTKRDEDVAERVSDTVHSRRETIRSLFSYMKNDLGYQVHRNLHSGLNQCYLLSRGEGHNVTWHMAKLSHLENRTDAQIRADRGEALIRTLPPHERINAVTERFFFGNQKRTDNRDVEESEYLVDVSPYVHGMDLCALIEKYGPLSPDRAIRYAIQIAEAIAHLHYHGVVWRDLKPENIMIRTSDDQILIVDLEFAKRICHNEPLSPLGSLDYLAPEAHNPELLQNDMLLDRMDSFSFGEILFTMLTGTLPFPGFDSAEAGIRAFAFGEDLKPLGKWVKDAALLALIQDLLIRRPEERMSVQQATECLKKIQEERTASHSSSSSSSSSSGSNSGSSSSSDAAASSSG